MYRYILHPIDEVGVCPYCKNLNRLYYMVEEREFFDRIHQKNDWTRARCRDFELACRPCLEAMQHKDKIEV